jgi:DNA-binding response OmpR family regulator
LRILVAAKEPLETDLVATMLRITPRATEPFTVEVCYDGADIDDALSTRHYAVAVVDRDLPNLDSERLCAQIVSLGHKTRILMLTTAAGLDGKITGLDLCADDYLRRPYEFAELLDRIIALVRRERRALPELLTVADITLNPANKTVYRAGAEVKLSSREFAVLEFIMRSDGTVVSADRIAESIWGSQEVASGSAVRVVMSRLRGKLGPPPPIRTVQTFGYQM